MKRFVTRFGLFTILTAALLHAGEPPTPPEAPPSKVLVRERTVYVPYEKLKETFEKEGRGVFLPYEEFIKLWNAGQPKEKPPEEINPPAVAVVAGGSYVGVAAENSVRFEVTYKVRALGKNWSEVALPLKNVAVENVTVSDPLAVFAPKGDGYVLNVPKPGEYTLTLAFSVRVDSKPGQRRIEFGIPPTAVSRLELTIPEKDVRVEVEPKMAASVTTQESNTTKVLAFAGNAERVAITWMPPASKIEKGKALLIATQSIHVEVGERTLAMDSALNYRIEANEEDHFRIKVPAGMRMVSVKANNMRKWTETNGELVVELLTPARDLFGVLLRFEQNFDKTPDKVDISFPIALDALREDGFITVGHDASLRLRVETSSGLSQIDARELPGDMRRENLLAGFRYVAQSAAQPLALSLRIERILPQIQTETVALATVGIEEDTLTGWVQYTISRAGIFKFELYIPLRYEVASMGDPSTVLDFPVRTTPTEKIVTVNLKNIAIGSFRLPFKLTAAGSATPGDLLLETVRVADTQQDKGLLGVSAPKAFKLTTGDRVKMTPANVQQLFATGIVGQLPREFDQPLTYSYTQQTVQQPASVKFKVERRETEIRAMGNMHTIVVSDSTLELSHKLAYVIEFAATDKLLFSMPSTLDDRLFSVQVAGLKEKKKISEDKATGRSTWEISLQEKVLNEIRVEISYKENLKGLDPEKPQDFVIPDVRAEGVKSQDGYIAVRNERDLELKPKPQNLEPLEAKDLPPEMRSTKNPGSVYLAYRYFQPDHALTLELTRHVPIDVTSTVIDLMQATFVVSDTKRVTSRIEMCLENARGQQDLKFKLPPGATIRYAAVNGVGLHPLKGEADPQLKLPEHTRIKLIASTTPFWVQVEYSAPLENGEGKMGWTGAIELKAPEILGGVPVNKIEANLYVPEEYAYYNFDGTLKRRSPWGTDSNIRRWVESHAPKAFVIIEPGAHLNGLPPVPGILGILPTQGKLFRLQTLSPQGTFSANYCDRKLLTLLDVLVFLGAIVLGLTLVSRKSYSAFWLCVGFIFVPLCMSWLIESEAVELPMAWVLAGLVLSVLFFGRGIVRAWHNWREERIRRAPDPFLEDAVVKPAATAAVTPPPAEPPKETPPATDSKSTETKKEGEGK